MVEEVKAEAASGPVKTGELMVEREGGLGLPAAAPLGRRGRPAVLTEEVREQLFLLLSAGFTRRQAASYLDIHPTTIGHAIQRDEEFALGVRRAEEISTVQPMMTLIAESRKNWRAAAWLLEHKLRYPTPLSDEQKAERDRERLADERRELAFRHQLRELHEADQDQEKVRRAAREIARLQPPRRKPAS